MSLDGYIRVIRKGWVLIVVFALLGLAAGAALAILATPQYRSTATMYVSVAVSDTPTAGDLTSGNSYAQAKVKSYTDIITSASVLDNVIKDLNLSVTSKALANQLSASSPVGTVIIELTATDPNPQQAANLANATAQSFSDVVIDDLEKPTGGGASLVKIQIVDPAIPATSPSSPNVPLNILLGAVVGIIFGLGAAFLRTSLDTRVHGTHDVEAVSDSPILGGISFDPESNKHPLLVHSDPRNPRAEAFRALRTNLRFVNAGSDNRCFVVTSSIMGEGKSTTSANLALALAETGVRVVLIDGDLRKPKLAEYMGLEGAVGLTDVLIGAVPLADVLQRWGNRELYVLPAGRVPPNPSELLGSDAMQNLLTALNEQVDYVIIDAPPLLPVTDGAIISSMTAGAIVVAASGKVKRTELARALNSLSSINSNIVGVVMTMLPNKGPDSYNSEKYGYYGAGPDEDFAETTPPRRRRGRK
ncbi:chromosome partitioning protein [Subtercola boreus]|uniref:non-specific protein-tyrosine kinase n=1 Tax=Subtercola boreus TaxID=120213 RepID=A0A3E0VEK0_9MICO|nr:polysaccharide biosynthesis tyrosine autokinase [Subtercola boreus]RFA08356.1 chromosome partitioning protein [Subtercola boreus]TQL54742.1 capsular exopolysaccharide synthesis family protein [Subtercola boreus]